MKSFNNNRNLGRLAALLAVMIWDRTMEEGPVLSLKDNGIHFRENGTDKGHDNRKIITSRK